VWPLGRGVKHFGMFPAVVLRHHGARFAWPGRQSAPADL